MKSENYQNFNILHYKELQSTNNTAKEAALNGQLTRSSVIICDIQTNGRGRMERKWASDPQNLHFSLVLRPSIELNKLQQLVFVAINALKEAIFELYSEKTPKISKKWPNDLLIDDKKVAGILIESLISSGKCDFAIIGIGVNIATHPVDTIFPASNLKESGLMVDKSEVLHKFLDKFNENYQNFLDFGFKKVQNKYIEDAWRLNEEISIEFSGHKNSGIFVGINENGDAVLKQGGNLIEISIGDVS